MTHCVMVLNDHRSTLNMYKTILKYEGYIVLLVLQADVTQADIEGAMPNLIILDWTYGAEQRGYERLQHLRAFPVLATTPVIVCTASHVVEMEPYLSALREQDVSILYKPFEVPDLLTIIESKFAFLDE